MRTAMIVTLLALAVPTWAANAVASVALDKEIPTLHSLGYVWTVSGDANKNASVAVDFRPVGTTVWRPAMPLRRIEVEAMIERKPPTGQHVFAGSILFLEPATAYDVRLKLNDPDGGSVTQQFVEQTRAEPVTPAPLRTLHVIPGSGGGSGTEADPYKGLPIAFTNAKAGDLVLLGQGIYTLGARLNVGTSGTSAAPIVFRGKTSTSPGISGGLAIIEGAPNMIAIGCYGRSHIFFERLTFRTFSMALQLNGSSNIVVRRCRMEDVNNGIFGDNRESRFFIADNEITGIEPFPRPAGWVSNGEPRGVQLSGSGHVVSYNRVKNFRDGIDVRSPAPVRCIDFHNNEISEMTDDGIELDFTDHNTRVFHNRITNTQTGISFQPIRGGPAYAVRNVLMNVLGETFKLKLSPTNPSATWETGPYRTSGGVMLHNTVVKRGTPFRVWSSEGPANHFFLRNNLLIGDHYMAIDLTMPTRFWDFDYDAFVAGGGTAVTKFAYWNKVNYATRLAFAQATGHQVNGLQLASSTGIFAAAWNMPVEGGTSPLLDARLAAGSPMINKGAVLPGINDNYAGASPDIGAVEYGSSLPHYGPRPLSGSGGGGGGGGGGDTTPPSISTPASALPATVTGTSTALSVQGSDNSGTAGLIYTWSRVSGPGSVTFAPNGSNAARNATASFSRAGSYTLRVTVSDAAGNSISSQVAVTVQAIASAMSINPTVAQVLPGGKLTFTARHRDQFGQDMGPAGGAVWTLVGSGVLDGLGVYTAPSTTGGPYQVSVQTGAGSAVATITVVEAVVAAPEASVSQGDDGDSKCGMGHSLALLLTLTGALLPLRLRRRAPDQPF